MRKVYQFGLRAPVENELLVRQQLRAAHDYQNDLVAIERGRRWALRALEDTEEVREMAAVAKAATRSSRREAFANLRSARKRARDAQPEELARIAALDENIRRHARALTPCFWGSYLDVEARANQSRQQPLYGDDLVTPNDPAFRRGPRWRDTLPDDDPRREWWLQAGQLGVQLQKGLSQKDLLAATDTRLRLEIDEERERPRPPGPGGQPREPRYTGFGRVRMRIGSEGRDPVWATWPIRVHRKLPANGVIKVARVSVRPDMALGGSARYERWSLEITVETPDLPPEMEALARQIHSPGAVAIEWLWTPLDDGSVRVAQWRDTDGEEGEVLLSSRCNEALKKAASIRSVRDVILNALKEQLGPVMKNEVAALPVAERLAWVLEAMNAQHLWRSPQRFTGLLMRLRGTPGVLLKNPGLPKVNLKGTLKLLDEWWKRDLHLYQYESCARQQALRARRDAYRVLASQWRERYGIVLLSNQDLTREARFGDDSDVRFRAGVSELRQCLRNAFGDDAIDTRFTRKQSRRTQQRQTENEDDEEVEENEENETPWRERVLASWTSGGARGDGTFAGLKKKTTNAWASRKAKKAEKTPSLRTPRKASTNPSETDSP